MMKKGEKEASLLMTVKKKKNENIKTGIVKQLLASYKEALYLQKSAIN